MQTSIDWLIEQCPRILTIASHGVIEEAKKMEEQQRGYTKEDVLKAGEIGEINHYDYKHIVKLLDEAREINSKSNKSK